MAATLPDFWRQYWLLPQIVQSPESVSIFYDNGQGQAGSAVPVTAIRIYPRMSASGGATRVGAGRVRHSLSM